MIDLDIIRGWVRKWERSGSPTRTASQVAAVMLSKALAQNECRAARVEKLMKEIIGEGNILALIEKKIALSKDATSRLSAGLQEECQRHKGRVAAILREADELMKEKVADQSMRVGGLLLEIGRQKPSRKDQTRQTGSSL
jgi:hypothetical protein